MKMKNEKVVNEGNKFKEDLKKKKQIKESMVKIVKKCHQTTQNKIQKSQVKNIMKKNMYSKTKKEKKISLDFTKIEVSNTL